MSRRRLFMMVACTILGRRAFLHQWCPVVSNPSDLPDGVPGLLAVNKWKMTRGVPGEKGCFYYSMMGDKMLHITIKNSQDDSLVTMPWFGMPSVDLEREVLAQAVQDTGGQFSWKAVVWRGGKLEYAEV